MIDRIVVSAVADRYWAVRDDERNWYEVSADVDVTSLDRGCSYAVKFDNDKIVEFEKIVKRLKRLPISS